MNIKKALLWAKNKLRESDVSEPESSALVLLGEVLGMSRTDLLAHPGKRLNLFQINKFKAFIKRRTKHESVWHIIGKVQFYGLDFFVNKDVLVPRPETELLVEQVIQQITNNKHQGTNKSQILNTEFNILDVGTGSGTIIISLARELMDKNSRFYIPELAYHFAATDISQKALTMARKNAKELKVEEFIKYIKTDLFPPKAKDQGPMTGKFDIVVANLPYIPSEDMGTLAFDVHHFEPKLALDGGKGGLEIYERFISQVGDYLRPNGRIFCEIGINQGEAFGKMVRKYLPRAKVQIMGDLAGIDRIAIIELGK